MTNPLHAAYYADRAGRYRVVVTENTQIARDTFRVRFECPELAARILPGQFVMLRLADCNDPLLGRPLALYDTVVDFASVATGIDVVYLVIGKLTSRLARYAPGQALEVWGPLGNGFVPRPTEHLIMVAGGIGQTPFVALARERLGLRRFGTPPRESATVPKVTLCYGARSKDYLAGVADFERMGVRVITSTDDGSAGHRGLVTELLERELDSSPNCHVVCCGPEKMMERVAHVTREHGVSCEVSLETPMACGIGICFSCVTKVREADGGWDYRRTCVEGPVFDAERIEWE